MVGFLALAYQRCFVPRVLMVAVCLLVAGIIAKPEMAAAKPAFSTIAIDARTGKVLYARNADSYRYPASLTKVMTLYLLFEDLRDGKISLSSRLKVSKLASRQAPSKLGLKPGRSIAVRDAIGALVTKSANDVAAVVAENLEGSVAKFAARMTKRARAIGMTRTTFKNPHGLPNSQQKTTARDMATLALRVHRDFPQYYRYFSLRSYKYGKRSYRNHNRLLGRVSGVDGIKTGYTRASGFNLTTSVRRNKKRIVAVVMGGKTGRSRNAYMTSLVNRMFKTKRLTRGKHLALVAGKPPGYRQPAVAVAKAKTFVPPKPMKKPLQANTKIASIAHGAAIETLAAPSTSTSIAKTVAAAAGTTFVAVAPPAEGDSPGHDQGMEKLAIDASRQGDIEPVNQAERKIETLADMRTTATVTTIAKTEEKDLTDDKATAKSDLTAHLRTWNIQIGAFPTLEGAESRLETALDKARRSLSGKKPFTMPTSKNGKTLFRARYSGFSRVSAANACKKLARRGVSCFALAPKG